MLLGFFAAGSSSALSAARTSVGREREAPQSTPPVTCMQMQRRRRRSCMHAACPTGRAGRRRPGRLALARGTFSDLAAVRAATVGTCARVRAHVSRAGAARPLLLAPQRFQVQRSSAMVPRAEATGEVEVERRPGPGRVEGTQPAPQARAAGCSACLFRLICSSL